MKRILIFLTKYEDQGASSRLRSIQYFPYFERDGFLVKHYPLISNAELQNKYDKKNYSLIYFIKAYLKRVAILLKSSGSDIIVIEKEAFPWIPFIFEFPFLFSKKFILDYDDAIFDNYQSHKYKLVNLILGNKIKKLIKKSRLTICGNQYLCSYAKKAGSNNVLFLPTVIDVNKYSVEEAPEKSFIPTIVWIGSPSTIHYLYSLKDVFIKLANNHDFKLRVIGDLNFNIESVSIENIKWSEDTEINEILNCDIGIMPLNNSQWELGKCGYKLIQYMGCGLPVVASKVGANLDIINQNIDGFLVSSDNEWLSMLSKLISNPKLRDELGKNGKDKIRIFFNLQTTSKVYIDSLKELN